MAKAKYPKIEFVMQQCLSTHSGNELRSYRDEAKLLKTEKGQRVRRELINEYSGGMTAYDFDPFYNGETWAYSSSRPFSLLVTRHISEVGGGCCQHELHHAKAFLTYYQFEDYSVAKHWAEWLTKQNRIEHQIQYRPETDDFEVWEADHTFFEDVIIVWEDGKECPCGWKKMSKIFSA